MKSKLRQYFILLSFQLSANLFFNKFCSNTTSFNFWAVIILPNIKKYKWTNLHEMSVWTVIQQHWSHIPCKQYIAARLRCKKKSKCKKREILNQCCRPMKNGAKSFKELQPGFTQFTHANIMTNKSFTIVSVENYIFLYSFNILAKLTPLFQ